MPNWCEGTLKVRGKKNNLEKFLTKMLTGCVIRCDKEYGRIAAIKSWSWVHETYRGFITEYTEIFLDDIPEDEEKTITLPFAQAWDISADDLMEVSKQCDIDLRIYAFEQGMQFNREIEVIKGNVTKHDFIHFDDYQWECPCPQLGG